MRKDNIKMDFRVTGCEGAVKVKRENFPCA
jgi:hypothetical protein